MAATWVVKGNLKGPKGDKGETGKSVRSSDIDIQSNATVPLANIKPNTNVAVGDTIFDVNGEVFTVTAVTEAGATVGTALSGVSMKGPQGVQGERGETGERGPQGIQGPQGAKGDSVAIAKTYKSVAAMNKGFATDNVKEGQFVIIDTGNVDDEDNAKLYVKGKTAYSYITDLSGAAGVQGPQGPQGQQGEKGERGDVGAAAGFGTPIATVDGNVGTPEVTVTATGDDTSKVFNFAFKNLKGATGDKGERGETGPAGANGDTGTRGSKWSVGTGTPTSADAIAGDQYLDIATGDVYTFA